MFLIHCCSGLFKTKSLRDKKIDLNDWLEGLLIEDYLSNDIIDDMAIDICEAEVSATDIISQF